MLICKGFILKKILKPFDKKALFVDKHQVLKKHERIFTGVSKCFSYRIVNELNELINKCYSLIKCSDS